MDERIEAFFKWFLEDKLANMDPDEYQQMLVTLVKLKKAADVRLGEEVSIYNHTLFGVHFFQFYPLSSK